LYLPTTEGVVCGGWGRLHNKLKTPLNMQPHWCDLPAGKDGVLPSGSFPFLPVTFAYVRHRAQPLTLKTICLGQGRWAPFAPTPFSHAALPPHWLTSFWHVLAVMAPSVSVSTLFPSSACVGHIIKSIAKGRARFTRRWDTRQWNRDINFKSKNDHCSLETELFYRSKRFLHGFLLQPCTQFSFIF